MKRLEFSKLLIISSDGLKRGRTNYVCIFTAIPREHTGEILERKKSRTVIKKFLIREKISTNRFSLLSALTNLFLSFLLPSEGKKKKKKRKIYVGNLAYHEPNPRGVLQFHVHAFAHFSINDASKYPGCFRAARHSSRERFLHVKT